MDFKDTYREEVYLSRKIRAQRAAFAAKLTGIALVLTVGAALRAEPELRQALFDAGVDTVSGFANLQTPPVAQNALPPATQGNATPRTSDDLPTSKVKINRPTAQEPDSAGARIDAAHALLADG